MGKKRKKRRVQYSPEEVVLRILHNELLLRVTEVIFESENPVHASDIGRKIGISIGYAAIFLRKLEKWGVLKAERDPVNGKLMFSPTDKRVAELLREELKKRRIKGFEEAMTHREIALG